MGQLELFYLPYGPRPCVAPDWPELVADFEWDGLNWWVRRDLEDRLDELVDQAGGLGDGDCELEFEEQVVMVRSPKDCWGTACGFGKDSALEEAEGFDIQDGVVYARYGEIWREEAA